ncbi:MotE family protein [Methylobrevis pamukkalensis]|uniref:MgtE intracellular N domain protein n=1 Tax=Methylobrevis pamukkalensis TaxID=1439726 RepID=A0A1E3GZ48_9HYPH|nr:hypothetical protein [Methylobrevis pamukkalensis]ODN69347.1 hypothetical protein A6302_03367 [Methylobrevis pamukkalensis]
MKDIRLLPIVLIAVSALLLLKVLGLATGETLPVAALGTTPAQAQETAAEAPPADGAAPAAEAAAPAEGEAAEAAPAEAAAEGEAAEGEAAEGEPVAGGLPVTTDRPEEVKFEDATSEDQLLERLAERRQELEKRDEEITMRARLLEAAESRLSDRVEELKSLETKIGVSVELKKAEDASKLKGLVTMYETMKPKDAARVFDQLAFDVLIPLVEQMNPRKMSAILAQMQPEIAGRLTMAIASKDADGGQTPVAAVPTAGAPAGQLPKIGPTPGN